MSDTVHEILVLIQIVGTSVQSLHSLYCSYAQSIDIIGGAAERRICYVPWADPEGEGGPDHPLKNTNI